MAKRIRRWNEDHEDAKARRRARKRSERRRSPAGDLRELADELEVAAEYELTEVDDVLRGTRVRM